MFTMCSTELTCVYTLSSKISTCVLYLAQNPHFVNFLHKLQVKHFSKILLYQSISEVCGDHFDRDGDGYIDLSEISFILRGLRRACSMAKKQLISESEKIEHEVS